MRDHSLAPERWAAPQPLWLAAGLTIICFLFVPSDRSAVDQPIKNNPRCEARPCPRLGPISIDHNYTHFPVGAAQPAAARLQCAQSTSGLHALARACLSATYITLHTDPVPAARAYTWCAFVFRSPTKTRHLPVSMSPRFAVICVFVMQANRCTTGCGPSSWDTNLANMTCVRASEAHTKNGLEMA